MASIPFVMAAAPIPFPAPFPFRKQDSLIFAGHYKEGRGSERTIIQYYKRAEIGDHICIGMKDAKDGEPKTRHGILARISKGTLQKDDQYWFIRFDNKRKCLIEEEFDTFVRREGGVFRYRYEHEDEITRNAAALLARRMYTWNMEGRYHFENHDDPTGERLIDYIKTGKMDAPMYGTWLEWKKWPHGNFHYLDDQYEINRTFKHTPGFMGALIRPASLEEYDPEDKSVIVMVDITTEEAFQNGNYPKMMLDKYRAVYNIGAPMNKWKDLHDRGVFP